MKIYTLEKKKVNEDKLSVCSPTLLFMEMDKSTATSIHIVTENEIGRIDIVSRSEYGSHDHVDHILKFNGISNPFSITEGDILYIPSLDSGKKQWKIVTEGPGQNPIRDQFINTKRLPVKDANRIQYLSKKYNKKILPPNILQEGEENISIKNGKITI